MTVANVWRFVVTRLRLLLWIREVTTPGRPGIVTNRVENCCDRLRMGREDRAAETYLRRIAVLTGATQTGNCYVLDVGKTRFFVRSAFVKCLRDTTDPQCTREETCFYPAHQEMPAAEKIGTALLQLKNNPLLFARWAVKSGAFKASGEPAHLFVQRD